MGDCIGELDLRPRLGGIRRNGEGDLRWMLGDTCCMGKGALLPLTGDGDLRRCIGEGDLRRRIGEGDLRRRTGEGDLRRRTG